MIRWRPNASGRHTKKRFDLTCYQHKDIMNQMDRVVLEYFSLISVADVPCDDSTARKYALENISADVVVVVAAGAAAGPKCSNYKLKCY